MKLKYDFYLNVILTIIHIFTCGYNLVARISCFRPDCTGSIPVTRSIFLLNSPDKYFLYESQVRDKGGA